MIEGLMVWANDYKRRAREVVDILNYHRIMPEDAFRGEGRIQAISDVLSFIEENKTKVNCEYCSDKPLTRKSLMYCQTSDYNVSINRCNHLEDNVVGGSVPHSVYGIKINYCPMCGRKL